MQSVSANQKNENVLPTDPTEQNETQIKNFLNTTGWTYKDLLSQLKMYENTLQDDVGKQNASRSTDETIDKPCEANGPTTNDTNCDLESDDASNVLNNNKIVAAQHSPSIVNDGTEVDNDNRVVEPERIDESNIPNAGNRKPLEYDRTDVDVDKDDAASLITSTTMLRIDSITQDADVSFENSDAEIDLVSENYVSSSSTNTKTSRNNDTSEIIISSTNTAVEDIPDIPMRKNNVCNKLISSSTSLNVKSTENLHDTKILTTLTVNASVKRCTRIKCDKIASGNVPNTDTCRTENGTIPCGKVNDIVPCTKERTNANDFNSSTVNVHYKSTINIKKDVKAASVRVNATAKSSLQKSYAKRQVKHYKKIINRLLNRPHKNLKTYCSPKARSESPPCVSTKTDEEVRNELRLQLNLLRNKKKPTDLLGRNNPAIYNDSSKSLLLASNKCKAYDVISSRRTPSVLPCLDDVLLSNEGDLQIINVVGGVDLNEHSDFGAAMTSRIKSKNDKLFNDDPLLDAVIGLTKTNDITCVKGWKCKKFVSNFRASIPRVYVTAGERRLLRIEDAVFKYDLLNGEPVAGSSKDDCAVALNVPYRAKTNSYATFRSIGTEDVNNLKESEKKSAFVSDALDEFLFKNSKLNISYEVPKLVAEEAITRSTDFSLLHKTMTGNSQPRKDKRLELTLKVKPKTLAEKRRMLEQARESSIKQDLAAKIHGFSRCTENNVTNRDMSVKPFLPIDTNVPLNKNPWSSSNTPRVVNNAYINMSGKKIYVTTDDTHEGFLCTIKTPKKNKKISNKYFYFEEKLPKKLFVPTKKSELYKAGPLCKKIDNCTDTEWTPTLKSLPKIKLELCPEIGKPFTTRITNLLFEHTLTSDIGPERARFATSVVKTKNIKTATNMAKKKFTFCVPFTKNQSKILMRRKNIQPITINLEAAVSDVPMSITSEPIIELSSSDTIKNIVNSMLDYVERKESFKTIDIDFDDSQEICRDAINRPPSPMHPMIATIIKQPIRQSACSLELRRLNVKVIEVNVVENAATQINCDNESCKLGCVCGSLQGLSSSVPDHCGRTECMFDCNCEYETKVKGHHKVTLPAGTDVLSAGTMVRLEDEAKRYLAKEEKKFTQTVIRANNQTIMVGSGLRDRSRRTTKVPTKYHDFVNNSVEFLRMHEATNEGNHNYIDSTADLATLMKPKLWSKLVTKSTNTDLKNFLADTRKPVVLVDKLPLDKLVPFCMFHYFYRCKCGMKPPPQVIEPKTFLLKEYIERSQSPNDGNSLLIPYKSVNYSNYSYQNAAEINIPHNAPPTDPNTSARTRGVQRYQFTLRNRSVKYVERFEYLRNMEVKKAHRKKFMKTYSAPKIERKTTSTIRLPIQAKDEVTKAIFKTKQGLVKVANANSILNEEALLSLSSLIDFTTSNSLLLKPTDKLNSEFQQMLGLKENSKMPFRLLSWRHLSEKYQNKTLHLWYSNHGKNSRLILTESGVKPSSIFKRISDYQKLSDPSMIEQDVIRYLITGTIPTGSKSVDDIFVVLAYNQANWEVRGIFEKKSERKKQKVEKLNEDVSITPVRPNPAPAKSNAVPVKPNSVQVKYYPVAVKVKPTPKVDRGLLVCKNNWELTELRSEVEITLPSNEKGTDTRNGLQVYNRELIHARLPPIEHGKWWVAQLQNDFTVLNMPSAGIMMKYSELIQVVNMASYIKTTLHIKPIVQKGKRPPYFGIFAVPDMNNRIFIGPYAATQKTDCEFLTVVVNNEKDISTSLSPDDLANATRNTALGKWYYQVNNPLHESSNIKVEDADVQIITETPVVIDLTEYEGTVITPINSEPVRNEIVNDVSIKEDSNLSNSDIEIIEVEDVDRTNKRKIGLNSTDENLPSAKKKKDVVTAVVATEFNIPKSTPDITITPFESDDVEIICNDQITSYRVPKYIVTNIHGLGYIEANYHCEVKFIDVFWPLTEEYWRFRKVDIAIKFVKELLRRRILFFPENFPIELTLLDTMPTNESKLSGNILEGFHMACNLGVFDIRSLNYHDFVIMSLNREDYLRMVRKKCFSLLNQQAKALGLSFLTPEQLKTTPNSLIVDMACDEIARLEKKDAELKLEKIKLIKMKEGFIINIGSLIDKLPEAKRIIAQRNLIKSIRNKTCSSNSISQTKNSINRYVKRESNEKFVSSTVQSLVHPKIPATIDTVQTPAHTVSMPVAQFMSLLTTNSPVVSPTSLMLPKATNLSGTSDKAGQFVKLSGLSKSVLLKKRTNTDGSNAPSAPSRKIRIIDNCVIKLGKNGKSLKSPLQIVPMNSPPSKISQFGTDNRIESGGLTITPTNLPEVSLTNPNPVGIKMKKVLMKSETVTMLNKNKKTVLIPIDKLKLTPVTNPSIFNSINSKPVTVHVNKTQTKK